MLYINTTSNCKTQNTKRRSNIEFYEHDIKILNEFCSSKEVEIQITPNNTIKKKGYIVILDGAECKNKHTFLSSIWDELHFPIYSKNWDAYLDWMRDLEWIEEKDIVIIVKNYNLFLSEELQDREYFITDFINVIFPYWENEAISVWNGNSDKVKNITLICGSCSDSALPKCQYCGEPTKWTSYKDSAGGTLAISCSKCGKKQPYPAYCLKNLKTLYCGKEMYNSCQNR